MMTKDELLKGFFYPAEETDFFGEPYQREKIIAVRCDTPGEMQSVMDWLIQNEGMTLSDDHGKDSFSIQAYNGNYEYYNCVTCRRRNRKWFDFYTERAEVEKISANEFFEIVSEKEAELVERPLNTLFGFAV